jgi:tetraacyldisaccharide 4'-kinase
MRFGEWLQTAWFRRDLAVFLWPLLPFSWLFGLVVALRRQAFALGLARADRLPVPVVVVGNLIVGGAGKTPTVLWLVERLRAAGRRPGIVSRGYGGADKVTEVRADSDPRQVGDEPVLLATRSRAPLFVGRRRAQAGRALLEAHPNVDVIVCDDGLQHLALARDVEIVVADGRGNGNGCLLPAGPLREPAARVRTVDAVVRNGADKPDAEGRRVDEADPTGQPARFGMILVGDAFYRLAEPTQRCTAADLTGKRLHAVAGIGHPQRFFDTLSALGLDFAAHPFPDHHPYSPADFDFAVDGVLLMTEKDAIKCRSFLTGEAWVLPVTATIEPDLAAFVLEKIDGRQTA